MKKSTSHVVPIAAVIAAAGMACSALGQQGQSSSQAQTGQQQGQHQADAGKGSSAQAPSGGDNQSSQSSQQQSPEGFVLIRQDVVYLMANEPQNHLTRAAENLALNDKQKSAGELDVAAAYINSMVSQDNDKSLSDCVDKLHQTAKDVRNGNLSDPKELSQTIARTNLALADHFQKKADQALGSHKQVKAGYDLRAAATSLEQALVWSKESPDQNRVEAIQNAQRASASLLMPAQSGQSGQSGQSTASGQQPQSGQQQQNQANANRGSQDPQQASKELAKQIDELQGKIAKGSSGNSQKGGEASGR